MTTGPAAPLIAWPKLINLKKTKYAILNETDLLLNLGLYIPCTWAHKIHIHKEKNHAQI